jgi:hypothetical protein
MATMEIRREEVGEVKDISSFFSKLNEKYSGKWVAILENGEVVAEDKLEDIYAKKLPSKIATLFQASKKGQMLLL